MKIELETPYKELYKKGYLRTSKKDGRRRVDLYNTAKDRSTISYARYLMSVKEGRVLTDDEEVDHIDEDKTNDDIDNLQILPKEKHKEKTKSSRISNEPIMIALVCEHCGKTFDREKRNLSKGRKVFCSSQCNGKYYHSKGFYFGGSKKK